MSTRANSSNIDLFSAEALADPYEQYAALRSAGAAVWLEKLNIWALPRYQQARTALMDWEVFSSKDALCVDAAHNQFFSGTVAAVDPPDHDRLRAIIMPSLSPRSLQSIKDSIEAQARDIVRPLLETGEFDAVVDMAAIFPVQVVCDLVGLPNEDRDRLLDRANAAINMFGPANELAAASMWTFPETFSYIQTYATRERIRPGSFGSEVYQAAERHEISEAECLPLMLAYLFAGMETTVNSIANAIYLFARFPDQWSLARRDRAAVGLAFEEALRFETPVQFFGRRVTRSYDAEGTTLHAGDRVIVMYGSANRDERKFPNPDAFDVSRKSVTHLAFGTGRHSCAGQALARLEGLAMLGALADSVERFELLDAKRRLNNVSRGFDSLQVKLHRA